MKKILSSVQELVGDVLMRYRSVLDVMRNSSNLTVASIVLSSAATQCGCIKICTEKQNYGDDIEKSDAMLSTHITGELCPRCREVLAKEAGEELYYFTALLNIFGIELKDLLKTETEHMETLGKFMLK